MKNKYYIFHSLYSTNETAKRLWSVFEPNTLNIVLTYNQISGKGRLDHKWISSSDSLTISFCFILPSKFRYIEKLFTLGVSSIQSLISSYIPKPSISFKWPNDILVNKKKICGILCETQTFSSGLGIILGIGLNINNNLDFCSQIQQPATSLFLETNIKYNIEDITQQLTPLIQQEIISSLY